MPELQVDEIRTIAGGKADVVWIFATINVWSRLWPSTVVGRRSYRNTRTLLRDTARILVVLSVGTYLYFGGARAVVWTDAVQGACLFLVILASAVLFTAWAGGLSAGFEKLSAAIPEKLRFNRENTPLFVDSVLSWPFAFFLWPRLFQRMFMARSDREIRRATVTL